MLRLLTFGALGYAGYLLYQKIVAANRPAFADNQAGSSIRDAGPESMRDKPAREWTKTDEESDQSFPASDPPANY